MTRKKKTSKKTDITLFTTDYGKWFYTHKKLDLRRRGMGHLKRMVSAEARRQARQALKPTEGVVANSAKIDYRPLGSKKRETAPKAKS